MANNSSLVFAGIAPHPPIMVPEVGQEAIAEVHNSIDAMAALTQRVIKSAAKTIILISPHAPLETRAFVAYDGPNLYGDFAMFRAPVATVTAQLDDELLTMITKEAADENLVTIRIRDCELDHGTTVPLYFLQRNGWSGRVVALGYSFLSNEDHVRFGRCIKRAIDQIGYPTAFVASGDLSHRLRPDAPAGYNPDAHLFDEEVVDAIRTGASNRILNMDQELRRIAGECGYRSMLVAFGVAEGVEPSCEVISYEAPFGVGYLVAQLVGSAGILPAERAPHAQSNSPSPAGGLSNGSESRYGVKSVPGAVATGSPSVRLASVDTPPALPALARQVIETFIKTGVVSDPPQHLSELLMARAGCFVCIKTHDGDLRGCIGTIEPVKDTLAEELIANAISSATRDPRFPPVGQDELPGLKYSVDVLSPPEPTTADKLDPLVYGVIVEDENGSRRGLLLPNLEGIETVTSQVEIAARKAGIAPGDHIKLFRFRADRYSE
jgi:MEMO1 family protein